jgi:hypothetical protein
MKNENIQIIQRSLLEELKYIKSVSTAIYIKYLNPSIYSIHNFIQSRNVQLREEDEKLIESGEWNNIAFRYPETKKVIADTLQFLQENKARMYYSSFFGYGVSMDSFKLFAYTFPSIGQLDSIWDEAFSWGSTFADSKGDLYWTFGLYGIVNYSCQAHSTVDCSCVVLRHNPELCSCEIRRKETRIHDPLMTLYYGSDYILDCIWCRIHSSSHSTMDLMENVLLLLQPYYTQYGFGKDRDPMPDSDFDNWIQYMPSVFWMYLEIDDDFHEEPCPIEAHNYFKNYLKSRSISPTIDELEVRASNCDTYKDALDICHLIAFLYYFSHQ